MNYFWRIFLATWAIFLTTVSMGLWVTSWWLAKPEAARGAQLSQEMVGIVAEKLLELQADDSVDVARDLPRQQRLDFGPVLTIYVLSPEGFDILGRKLPEIVATIGGPEAPVASAVTLFSATRLHVHERGLRGYRVIGVEGFFPIFEVVGRPGGRAMLFLLLLCISASVSWMLARFIVLPVTQLRLAGQEVADGNLAVRVAPSVGNRTDEIARLAQEFDRMTERVGLLLGSQRRLMRDVSHELRSPLARLQALLSIARQKASAEFVGQIDRMEAELECLDELIGEILTFARLEAQSGVTRQPTDIIDLVQNIVDDASVEGRVSDKEIFLEGPPRVVVAVDSGLIQSGVENVVRNALGHAPPGSHVSVRVLESNEAVRILVEDEGPGVPEALLEKIFEPFFQVNESGSAWSGTGGIGLAIVQRSVRLHGGTVTASNRARGGLCIEIFLPILA